jgi:hypothetical protein
MKLIKLLILVFVLNLNFVQAAEVDYAQQVKMFEACADDKFKNYYGSSYEDFVKTSLKNKLMTSQPYEWLYEDCEAQSHSKPITFKLKNKLYEQDLKEITKKIFEKCTDQRYLQEYGEKYISFLEQDIKTKMNELEYEWFVEACEDEYQNYPIKFRLKYY